MAVGDEFVVRMPGPWDGPVRVVDVQPTSFRLVTLAGHLEAGQIEFTAQREADRLVFHIESWARSGDRLSDLLYDRVRMAKEIQLHMWTSLLERVARVAERAHHRRHRHRDAARGRWRSSVSVRSRPSGHGPGSPICAARGLNFDPGRVGRPAPGQGWHVDDLRQPLPGEPPGPPRPGQTWEVARHLMRHYKVADPSIVRAFYDDSEPLQGRTMLLELRFWRLRFPVGVRVGDVYDEPRDVAGRPARVSGWNYRTLEGHLEIGQMAWEVWKWEDSGAVEFHIHAFSRAAPTGSVLVRIGLRLFARREQLRFYRHACARMRSLTIAGLSGGAG